MAHIGAFAGASVPLISKIYIYLSIKKVIMLKLNQVYHGDCLEVMHEIDDKSIDMILCDLPYGTTACKWDTIIPLEPLWSHYKRIIKDNGAIVLTATEPFASYLRMSNIKWYKYDWVWEKTMATGAYSSNNKPLLSHENILIFYDKQPVYNQQRTTGNPYKRIEGKKKNSIIGNKEGGYVTINKNGRCPRSVIKIKNPNYNSLHSTQKPVKLFEYLIRTYTNEGDLVLDNCAGSGTTGIACRNLNRNFILIEKEKEYVEIIKERLSEPHQERLFI